MNNRIISPSSMNTVSNTSPFTADGNPRIPVGQVYVQNPGPWWVPAGLESTQGPGAKPIYTRPAFFGADREYGEDEGWQTQISRRQRRLARRRHRVVEDTYDFDDDEY